MVSLRAHDVRLNDKAAQTAKIGADFTAMRADHLLDLDSLEEVIRAAAPLPASYDVTRIQPPFFSEFTYTEMMGGIYVAPQSSEIAARVVAMAENVPPISDFDAVDAIMSRDRIDKYKLRDNVTVHRRVAFIPGTNVFGKAVCKEVLTRAMHDDPELVIKPHPLTTEDTLRTIGRLYGYHRVLEPQASGWALLEAADEVLVPATSEMGLYAILSGKPIINLTKVGFEARAVYTPFYRLLWGLSPALARERLTRLLASPASGFFHPSDPDAAAKASTFYAAAMELREPFRPLVLEYEPPDYGAFILNGAAKP